MVLLVALLRFGVGECAVEVVERGQQFACQPAEGARLRGGGVAPRALAHVVGLGDGTQVEILVVRLGLRCGRRGLRGGLSLSRRFGGLLVRRGGLRRRLGRRRVSFEPRRFRRLGRIRAGRDVARPALFGAGRR